MKKKIILNVATKHYNALLLEDNNLVEYHQEQKEQRYQIGNLYLATVKKIIVGLNAAFVDIGHKKLAFLHYSDVSPYMLTMQKYLNSIFKNKKRVPNITDIKVGEVTNKDGQIKNVLKEGQKIIVQIYKEPISTKGIRVTSCINLAGRYLILTPFHNGVTISKKITESRERNRLEQLITSLKRNNFGVIVRTLAQKKEAVLLDQDFEHLVKQWEEGMQVLHTCKEQDSACLIQQPGALYTLLQNLLNEEFEQIVVDDFKMHKEIKAYVSSLLPGKENIVHLYQGQANIFQYLGIEKKIKNMLSKIVTLPSGGYLIVEHTEAMHVIDVNTGSRINLGADQETLALEVNLESAKMVAELLRFRGDGLGGITLVDFVGMRNPQHRRKLYEAMKQYVKADRFRVQLTPLTRFGLMEITRPRVRAFTQIDVEETCPTCQGTGTIQPSVNIAEQLEQRIKNILHKSEAQQLNLYLHPFLYAYVNRGLLPKTWQWWWTYKKSINICEDPSLAITDYNILDHKNQLLAQAPQLTKSTDTTYDTN